MSNMISGDRVRLDGEPRNGPCVWCGIAWYGLVLVGDNGHTTLVWYSTTLHGINLSPALAAINKLVAPQNNGRNIINIIISIKPYHIKNN